MEKTYWKTITSTVMLAILIVLSFLLLKPILLSIISGIILAFIFTPLYSKVIKRFPRKNLMAFLMCVLFILIILVPLWLIMPTLVDQSISIFFASQKMDFITPLQNLLPGLFQVEGFSNEIGSIIFSFVTKITNSIMNMVSGVILNFPTLFLQSLVMFFTFFFVLRDNEKFIAYVQSLLPFPKEVEKKLFKSSRDITFSILYGQVILGVLQGLVVGIGFFLFGVQNALFLTILAAIAGIFPIIGTSIIWIPVFLYLLIQGNILAAIGILVFGMITMFIENGFKPTFVSKRTNINSAIILLGMVGGLFFIGILGVIIGPLILAYLLIILEIYRDKRTPGFFIEPASR